MADSQRRCSYDTPRNDTEGSNRVWSVPEPLFSPPQPFPSLVLTPKLSFFLLLPLVVRVESTKRLEPPLLGVTPLLLSGCELFCQLCNTGNIRTRTGLFGGLNDISLW